MTSPDPSPKPPESMFQDESALRWGFLEDNPDACAVVSDRMELVYMNAPARELVSRDWFGRRCFEIFPTANEVCAFHCKTMTAVHEAQDIHYCEENLRSPAGSSQELGVAVLPLQSLSDDEARALLLLRPKETTSKEDLLAIGAKLRTALESRFGRGDR